MEVIVGRSFSRILLTGSLFLAVAACSSHAGTVLPGGASGAPFAQDSVRNATVPQVGGVYNGTVTETSQGRTVKAKLKITLKQSGAKFTGIFDMILKTIQDQFPIIKGSVLSSHGKTILHFVIEGSPGRNAKAVATLVGKALKGKARVSARNGPAARFQYSATKA